MRLAEKRFAINSALVVPLQRQAIVDEGRSERRNALKGFMYPGDGRMATVKAGSAVGLEPQ